MAKKTYTVLDEEGHTWVVFPKDPAFTLVSTLKHPMLVLPQGVIRSGTLEGVNYDRWIRAADSIAAWLNAGYKEGKEADPEVEASLVRTMALNACLDQLRILESKQQEETTQDGKESN